MLPFKRNRSLYVAGLHRKPTQCLQLELVISVGNLHCQRAFPDEGTVLLAVEAVLKHLRRKRQAGPHVSKGIVIRTKQNKNCQSRP